MIHVPWKRFWTLPHGSIHRGDRDGGGFLTDPENSLGRFYNKAAFTLEQLASRSCLVLCGEPGMGKTTTIGDFRASNATGWPGSRTLLFEHLRTVPDPGVFRSRVFDAKPWRDWLASAHDELTLVIDGVDEGRIKIPGFVEFLTEELRRTPVDRLQLILLCRTLDWPWAQGEALFALWGRHEKATKAVPGGAKMLDEMIAAERRSLIAQNAVYELCPLRWEDAELAATVNGVDAECFLRAVRERQVEGLAARPVTLMMLLDEFARSKTLSGGNRELYRRHIRALCEDPDLNREHSLPAHERRAAPEQLRRVAGRLAALYLLCGRSAFYIGRSADAQEGDLTLNDCVDEGSKADKCASPNR